MKNTSKNMIVALISRTIIILAGIVSQRFILVAFGSEINGLTSSIAQFMSYSILLEAGLGTASIQALYKPLSSGDNQGVSGILNATKLQYRNIGYVFFAVWTAISFLMPFIIKSHLSYGFVCSVTFLSGCGNILTYLFIGKFTVLLNSDKKIYVLHTIDTIIAVLNCVIKILIINAGYSIVIVQITVVGTILLRLLILNIYFKCNYKHLDKKAAPNLQATRKRWNVMIHNIVGLVTNNTDILVLTVFSNLQNVSVYSVYNTIYGNLNTVISTTFSHAIIATFGQMMERREEKLLEYYRLFELFFTTALHIILVSAFLVTLPFISLYTKSVVDINYVDFWIAILFVAVQYMYLIRTPAIMIITSGGYFRETQRGAIFEAAINISISITMFFFMGMKGLLIGTIAALLFRSTDLFIFVYKRVLHLRLKTLGKILLNHLVLALGVVFAYSHWIQPSIKSWVDWLFYAIVTFLFVSAVFILNLLIFYRKDFKMAGKLLFSIRLRGKT